MIPLAALGRFDRELAWAVYLLNEGNSRMARVGFAGIQGYVDGAQGELDARADRLADRVDQVKGRGLGTLDRHDKRLDGVESQIDHMDAMVRDGSNGAPTPLEGSASPSEPQPQPARGLSATHPSARVPHAGQP